MSDIHDQIRRKVNEIQQAERAGANYETIRRLQMELNELRRQAQEQQ